MAQASAVVDTAVGEAYEQHMVPGMFLRWTRLALQYAAPRPGESVLDLACGTGIGARLAAAVVGSRGRVSGVDIDPGVIEVAGQIVRGTPTTIEWHCANALDMPFADSTFDLCLCLQGLQFFPDRLAGFREIHRVLKPTGRLIATIWGPLESNKGHQAVVRALESQNVDASPAKRACSFSNTEDIKKIAASAGFVRIEVHTLNGDSEFSSMQSFLDGMTKGSPSTRHAVAGLPEAGRNRFDKDVREMLAPYLMDGLLAYPMQSHILCARVGNKSAPSA
jgi:ubiquinone/menaquinone biosynthesis C-methylase UbiE